MSWGDESFLLNMFEGPQISLAVGGWKGANNGAISC